MYFGSSGLFYESDYEDLGTSVTNLKEYLLLYLYSNEKGVTHVSHQITRRSGKSP